MKKRLLGLLVLAAMCLVTCGNEPPEPFYEGTPEDDAQIDAILTNDYPELLNTIDGFIDTYVYVNIPAVVIEDPDRILRADSPLIKQHIDSTRFVFVDSNRLYDRWYTKDTACTVYLVDTFTAEYWGHVDFRLVGHYDSLFIGVTGDTNYILNTIDTIIPVGDEAYYMDTIVGDGRRHVFFEPLRSETPVVDPETGDTTYPLIEPLDWELKRISYGRYYYPTYGTDNPYIVYVILAVPSTGRADTILASSTDTLYTGHAMNRFRHIDSLLEYSVGDSVQVTIELLDDILAPKCAFYAVWAGGDTLYAQRRQLASTFTTGSRGYLTANGAGIVNVYFEVVIKDSYYYVNPDKGYLATVWLVPVRMN